MVFNEILKNVVDQVPGAIAAMVMGYDGIPLDQFQSTSVSNGSFDLQSMGVEYCTVINEIKKNAENLGVESMQELTLRAQDKSIVIRIINDEYFLIMALDSSAFFGKGRYLLRHAATRVLSEL